MIFPQDNYVYQLWVDNFENHGFYFDYAAAALGAEPVGAPAGRDALAGGGAPRSPAVARGARSSRGRATPRASSCTWTP